MNEFLMVKGLLVLMIIVLASCSKDEEEATKDGDWLIPKDEVRDGGPGKDGIPSVDDPKFINKEAADYLEGNDLVVGIKMGNAVKAYSHPVLNHHEIVNDEIDGHPLALTYCPLTGTAIGVSRKINGSVTTFGVSGLLFNNNLIPYDRKTESNWSQMKLKAVNGQLSGKDHKVYQVVETTWATWQSMYPNTQVLSTETGHSRNYQRFPYGNYKNNDQLLFPVTNRDDRLPKKERVHGVVVNGSAKVYRFNAFKDSNQVIIDDFNQRSIVVVGDQNQNFIASFFLPDNKEDLSLAPVNNELPVVMKDEQGNRYSIFGRVISGPDEGNRLEPTTSYMGYWFAWAAFYPNVEIYNSNQGP